MRWGDGVVDSRSGADFYVGDLQEEVASFGLDALTPTAPSFSMVPAGTRFIVRMKHVFNRALSSLGAINNWLVIINKPEGPTGKEMQHEFPIEVKMPAEQDAAVELRIPEL